MPQMWDFCQDLYRKEKGLAWDPQDRTQARIMSSGDKQFRTGLIIAPIARSNKQTVYDANAYT